MSTAPPSRSCVRRAARRRSALAAASRAFFTRCRSLSARASSRAFLPTNGAGGDLAAFSSDAAGVLAPPRKTEGTAEARSARWLSRTPCALARMRISRGDGSGGADERPPREPATREMSAISSASCSASVSTARAASCSATRRRSSRSKSRSCRARSALTALASSITVTAFSATSSTSRSSSPRRMG